MIKTECAKSHFNKLIVTWKPLQVYQNVWLPCESGLFPDDIVCPTSGFISDNLKLIYVVGEDYLLNLNSIQNSDHTEQWNSVRTFPPSVMEKAFWSKHQTPADSPLSSLSESCSVHGGPEEKLLAFSPKNWTLRHEPQQGLFWCLWTGSRAGMILISLKTGNHPLVI